MCTLYTVELENKIILKNKNSHFTDCKANHMNMTKETAIKAPIAEGFDLKKVSCYKSHFFGIDRQGSGIDLCIFLYLFDRLSIKLGYLVSVS